MVSSYAVTWKKKPFPHPFLVDVDSMELAAEIAVRLNYQGGYEVRVTSLEFERDPELMERIRKRINERLGHEWAIGVLTA